MPAKRKSNKADTVDVPVQVMRQLLYGNTTTGISTARMDFMNRTGTHNQFSGTRNIREVAGYPEILTYNDFLTAYDRQDVATRVIETYPDYTWIDVPSIYETEKPKDTKFEKDIKALFQSGEVISTLRALDILAGIGEFGLLVIGLDDGGTLDSPTLPISKSHKIMYMRPYTEGEVTIKSWDIDPKSERYMMPLTYQVTPAEYTARSSTLPMHSTNFIVHHSRCIHFADNALNSVIYGTPRLKRVYDRLMDILKIVAGSGEMFWRGAYQGFSFEAEADGEFSDDDKTAMKESIQKYLMGMDRAMLLKGVKTNSLAPSVSSPKEHLDAQLTMVSIASRIPKRILTGSEMGKLASTQDAANWAQQIKTRRTNVAAPKILRPFIQFCVKNHVIAAPEGEFDAFTIEWPALELPTDKDQSEIAMNFTNALVQYATNNIYIVIPFNLYLQNVWNYPVDRANEFSAQFDTAAFEKLSKELNEKKSTTGVQTPKSTKNETPEP